MPIAIVLTHVRSEQICNQSVLVHHTGAKHQLREVKFELTQAQDEVRMSTSALLDSPHGTSFDAGKSDDLKEAAIAAKEINDIVNSAKREREAQLVR